MIKPVCDYKTRAGRRTAILLLAAPLFTLISIMYPVAGMLDGFKVVWTDWKVMVKDIRTQWVR